MPLLRCSRERSLVVPPDDVEGDNVGSVDDEEEADHREEGL